MKVKPLVDVEFEVLDILEGMTNTNEAFTNELGYTARSKLQEGLVPNGMLGKFVCQSEGETFYVAPGKFSHEERREIWKNREAYLGKMVKVRYMGYGIDRVPRQPRALGWRSDVDM